MNGALIAKWVLGPLVLAAVAGAFGRARSAPSDAWLQKFTALSAAEQKAFESAPALAVFNAAWSFGDAETVKRIAHNELDRVPESEGAYRARTFLRFGIVDMNPDGQAAVFALACASDAQVCDHTKEAAEREVQGRFVAPGNTLPLSLIGGHPPIGPR